MPRIKVDVCHACKKMFENPYDRDLCPICSKAMEDKFDGVRKYIRSNKTAGVHDVSEACAIPKRQILKWIREERLYFAEGSDVGVPCLQCGLIIQTGKYCNSCKTKLSKDLRGVLVHKVDDDIETNKSNKNKMRFLNKDR